MEFTLKGTHIPATPEMKDRHTLAQVTRAYPGKFQTVSGHDAKRGHDVTFKGKRVGSAETGQHHSVTIYLTPKSNIAVFGSTVHNSGEDSLDVYATFAKFKEEWEQFPAVVQLVAHALGQDYAEILDI